MKNPITGDDLNPWQTKRVEALRTVRRNARKGARSGNPAKREPARHVLGAVGDEIRATYLADGPQ